MKKLFLALALLMAVVYTTQAQSKKNPSKVTEITVNMPTFYLEYSGLILDIYDREGQRDGIVEAQREDVLAGKDPRDPEINLIHMPEVSERAYRFAESLVEQAQDPNGTTVIRAKQSDIKPAKRTKFN